MNAQSSEQGYIRLTRMQGGTSWPALVRTLGEYAEQEGLAHTGLADALIHREKLYPTGIQASFGVAIPHADQKFTHVSSMVVATLEQPVLFKPMGEGTAEVPVEIAFLLLMKNTGKHIDLLETIVALIQQSDTLAKLKGRQALSILSEHFDAFFPKTKPLSHKAVQ